VTVPSALITASQRASSVAAVSEPDFDEKARQRWNSERFYNDPTYYFDRNLVRPYRVGMSCAFCHVGPTHQARRSGEPGWENLSANVGAQYFWWDRVFNWRAEGNEASFFYQALHVSRPGTLDTSLVSTDSINNPRTMNAVYYLLPRMMQARKWGKESIAGGGARNKQFNDFVPPTIRCPSSSSGRDRLDAAVLKDGSDSVGGLGALNRVYLNIGLFSEEWCCTSAPSLAVSHYTDSDRDGRKNSVYWRATEMRTPDMARFFLSSTDPHHLKDAPAALNTSRTARRRWTRQGRVCGSCARCHSSKLPDLPAGWTSKCERRGLPHKWNQYWNWTKTDGFKSEMRKQVMRDDFSTAISSRVSCASPSRCSASTPVVRWRPMPSRQHLDNFSSQSYKELPSVGSIKVRHPVTGAEYDYPLPRGGAATSARLRSSASGQPHRSCRTTRWPLRVESGVDARMRSFDDSIEQMLWPEKRQKDALFANENGRAWASSIASPSTVISRFPRATFPITSGRSSTSVGGCFRSSAAAGIRSSWDHFPKGCPWVSSRTST
jgi:hypothetical protein